MKLHVCTTCGSPRVMLDAWVNINDPDDVRTYDDKFCEDCDGACSTKEVEVDNEFDVYGDFYDENN